MNKKNYAWLTVAFLVACGQQNNPQTQTLNPVVPAIIGSGDDRHFESQVVINYTDETSLNTAVRAIKGTVLGTLPEIKAALVSVKGSAIKATVVAKNVAGVVAQLNYANVDAPNQDPTLTIGQTDLQTAASSPDQFLDGVNSIAQYALDPRHLNAKVAWDKGFDGNGVVVAIVDDPSDISSPELNPTWSGLAYDPATATTYTNATAWRTFAAAQTGNYHGTYTASTVAAALDGKGVVGIAPKAKTMPIAIFNSGYVGDFAVARGVIWATNNGAKVQNHSWGGGGVGRVVLKDAFDYALSNGVSMIVSAGNDYKETVKVPAGLPGTVASGAAKGDRNRLNFSNTGRHISSVAPGFNVLLSSPTWANTFTSQYGTTAAPTLGNNPGQAYGLISGTSFSGPYTAGIAAMILGKCPNATPYQVRRVMEETADATVGTNASGFDKDTGWGHLNAGAVANRLSTCANLPAKGSVAKVEVQYYTGAAPATGLLANVILREKGLIESASNDPSQIYEANVDSDGVASFYEIKPGAYDIYVAGPDITVTGDLPSGRGVLVGSMTTTVGSSHATPDTKRVLLTGTPVNLNPTDPYEPNDTFAQSDSNSATALTLNTAGVTGQTAYIFGKPRDFDVYRFTAAANDKVQIQVNAQSSIGGALDSFVTLYDSAGTVIASNDDNGSLTDSFINTTTLATAGMYYIEVTSYDIDAGGTDDSPFNKYQLKLTKIP